MYERSTRVNKHIERSVEERMFRPELATVLSNKCEDAEARLSAFEAAFGDKLAKRGLRINYLAYFENALDIPLKEIDYEDRA